MALSGLNIAPGLISLLSTNLCLAVAIVAVSLWGLYQWLLPRPLHGIAYNTGATKRLFGDAPDMIREMNAHGDFGLWCAKQFDKMKSPICQVFVRPFSTPWVLISDFRESQDILTRRAEFDKPAFLVDSLAAMGDFHIRLKTNSEFKARRALKQDLMAPTFLHEYMGPAIHGIGLRLIEILEHKMQLAAGRPFSVQMDFSDASLDVMLAYAFGESWTEKTTLETQLELVSQLDHACFPAGGADEPVVFPKVPIGDFLKAVHDAPHVLEMTTTSWMPRLSHWWWSQQSWYKKIFSHKTRVVPEQLSKAVHNYRSGNVKTAVEHMLMREDARAKKQGHAPVFESKTMVDEIFGDLIAGHHTTGASMGWLMKFLAGYPDKQANLRAALYSAVPRAVAQKRFPTFDELRRARIPYLEACIEEMLRLTPFVEVRETTRETDLLGHRLPKGCQVFMVASGPGFLSPSIPIDEAVRSPTARAAKVRGSWDESRDLREFEPERWLVRSSGDDGSVEFNGAAGPQLGFGLGVRQCWGRRLAHMEIRTIIALVVWNFDLLEIPGSLGGYDGYDGISRQPKQVFVRLRKAAS